MLRMRLRAGIAAALLAATFAAPATADDYPSKPIKFIVPTAPAGIGDMLPRLFQAKLAEAGNTATIVVENRAGAAGVIGVDSVAKAAPDGYTFLVGNHAVMSMLPHLTRFPTTGQGLRAGRAARDGAEHPGGASFRAGEQPQGADRLRQGQSRQGDLCVAGRRRVGHIAGELFRLHAGIDVTHVPYKGAAPAAQDLAAGHVSMMFDVVSLALGPIQSGRVRPIGVASSSARRAAGLADADRARPAGGRRLVRLHGAGRHAAGGGGLAESRGQQGVRHAGRQRPLRQAGRRRAARHAGSVRQVHGRGIERYGDVIRRAGIRMEQR